MKGIEGRVHVIIGGYGDGIGSAIATFLAQRGGKVVITGRDEARGRAKVEKLRADIRADLRFVPLDVTDSSAVESVAARLEAEVGPVHGVVVNAGISRLAPALDYTDRDWRETMAVNLDGAFFCCRSFGQKMRGRGGSIVLISSIAAQVATRPARFVAYAVSKAGVTHLARVLGVEWATEGIRVNAVEPGFTRSGPIAELAAQMPDLVAPMLTDTPMGRLVDPQEVASAVGYLISDLSSATTGSRLVVDGGYTGQ